MGGTSVPPGYPPPGYGASVGFNVQLHRPTSGLAIGALIAAFVFAPAGLVLGFMAKKEIQRTGADGDGLATAAIVISIIAMVVWVIAFVSILSTASSIHHDFNNFGPGPNGY